MIYMSIHICKYIYVWFVCSFFLPPFWKSLSFIPRPDHRTTKPTQKSQRPPLGSRPRPRPSWCSSIPRDLKVGALKNPLDLWRTCGILIMMMPKTIELHGQICSRKIFYGYSVYIYIFISIYELYKVTCCDIIVYFMFYFLKKPMATCNFDKEATDGSDGSFGVSKFHGHQQHIPLEHPFDLELSVIWRDFSRRLFRHLR